MYVDYHGKSLVLGRGTQQAQQPTTRNLCPMMSSQVNGQQPMIMNIFSITASIYWLLISE